jgi:predicted 3-demethylubiquinone-9 3-methyltransferase (glyoxalase superfamily)
LLHPKASAGINSYKKKKYAMKKITPFLMFEKDSAEAMKFYVSVFKNSKITSPGSFELEGQEFLVYDGGPYFKFSEGISLFVDCNSQAEVDELWDKLSSGGEKSQCGWVKDKFGLSWQIIPSVLMKYLNDPDSEKSKRVMEAMLKMGKIVIKDLEKAYNQK